MCDRLFLMGYTAEGNKYDDESINIHGLPSLNIKKQSLIIEIEEELF